MKQHPKKVINRYYVILNILLIILFIGCSSKKSSSIGEGKLLYLEKCVHCHSMKSSINDKSSLFQIGKLDSLILKEKLAKINSDSTHYQYFADSKLSEKDIKSLFMYIRNQQMNQP